MNPFVSLSPRAVDELNEILDYLEENFGVNSAANSLDEIEKISWKIAAFPFLFPAFKGRSVRKAVINKHLSIFYQVRKETIEILSFWDNRKDSDQTAI